jgi:hypothetical protein
MKMVRGFIFRRVWYWGGAILNGYTIGVRKKSNTMRLPMRGCRSLKYTFKAEQARVTPRQNINCIITISGNTMIEGPSSTPKRIKNTNNKGSVKIKFIMVDITVTVGRISGGNIACLISPALPTIEFTPRFNEEANQIHGTSPLSRNAGYRSICIRITIENTKV